MSRRADGGRPRAGREDGAVTAEFALVLPAVVLMIGVVAAAGMAGATQVRCIDAAAAAARLASRGEDSARVLDTARRLAPDGASVSIDGGGDDVTVAVRTRLALPLIGGPGVDVVGSATTPREEADLDAGP